jgi:hypothetical protein
MHISGAPTSDFCAACGARVNPRGTQYAIHRDGFGKGPEVTICKDCGAGERPTCEELWAMIAKRLAAARDQVRRDILDILG